jgi:hypothetical protein
VPEPAVIVTTEPEIVQAPDEVTVTASPELADAATVNVLPKAADAGAPVNVIVWAANAAVTVRTTFAAALKFPLPAWDAVSVQVPVPLVIVTVLPEMVQTPAAAMVTARLEDDVAVAVNVVL